MKKGFRWRSKALYLQHKKFILTQVKPIPSSDGSKKEQVESMFDSISHKYDFLNRVLSMGTDNIWRKKCVNELKSLKPERILDVATGTGDLAISCLKLKPKSIVGLDLSAGMLEIGKAKMEKKGLSHIIKMMKGDSENLPFEDNRFDAITVGFGVRNFENLEKGLKEMKRVLRTGGKVAILEFSKPTNPVFAALYNFYFHKILPAWGKLVSKSNSAYTYLPNSVEAFPNGKDFLVILESCGYKQVNYKPLTFGICSIYTGIK
jgi:demethylmenaquinone methyltransferase/2-methoxy-6-polyprenyl-1,4-benzoquinol methylase